MSLETQTTHHQLPPLPHRLPASSCPLHPDEHVTDFYASCLHECLTGLDTSSTSGCKSTSLAFKSLFFKVPTAEGGGGGGALCTSSNASSSSFSCPELHRCKSFSYGHGDGLSGPRTSAAFEPQCKSCDVYARNTLWSLFHQDNNERDKHGVREPSSTSTGEIEVECRNLGFPLPSSVVAPVLETCKEEEEEEEEEEERDNMEEIRVVDPILVVGTLGEIEGGEWEEEEEEAELKSMKDHIDLNFTQAKKPPSKDLKEIAGSFWLAASIFSKKL